MSKKILHIAGCDKFIPPYIQFVNENFNSEEHDFIINSGMASGELQSSSNIYFSGNSTFSKLKHYFHLIIEMHQADKVIVHALFNIKIVQILFFAPWLLKKCCWVIWGGDLYTYQLGKRNKKWQINEFFRRPVIKRIGHLVTYIEGDIALARKWYGATGKYQECLMYTSNLYKEYEVSENKKTSINIQVGNSADPSNNHIEALEKLLPFKDEDICIFVPLSYGSKEYAKQVITQGKELFGDKFKPLREFMPFEEYLSFLGSIDIAIFNHKRQQAMGNTITLLGLGKTVYLRSDTSQWQFFETKGIKIGDVEMFNSLERYETKENIKIVKEYFSQKNYKNQLAKLFEL
ncbi:TDP-N-acetylfucosamine:lipid II N-acetylfucosaminyltransferase [Shewanella sp. LC6]|uniref:TDP-N-acetylfucosamine:lipid II N-acetylfucosaminyltransferase n=1 Tax=unclassified Shewanella TaxID=196818 RepID=UPI00112CE2CA|nr:MULTISPECIES: TDP-N-acetylfucosamine:lipid II N-acetylfucosaminyltransferase [unclassified Shewanella]QQK59346.1 TDP-N-acetylfucosamine:lipid II N-acetylfucosaminyltransferase [Shewanella sp. LC6]TPE56493.1 TDP-N-acetylfucosamine:lipid II N-acetylfucosaminyltransferase [Shewanella sp. LC2]